MRRPAIKNLVLYSRGAGWLWSVIARVPWLRSLVNRIIIDRIAASCPARPLAYSAWGPHAPQPVGQPEHFPVADYTSWAGLVDRGFSGRHLPPADEAYIARLADPELLVRLFARGDKAVPCPRSSTLFCFFAQWFTDSFLRTDPNDSRRNLSNHEIDLCQIYGLRGADTALLRAGRDGLLGADGPAGAELPQRLYEDDGETVRAKFAGLSYIDPDTGRIINQQIEPAFDTHSRRREFIASGLERGNSSVFYAALSTIFLREHNRLAREIRRETGWRDDSRLFEAARAVNIAQLIKIILEDYINHVSGTGFRFSLEVGMAERKPWYRPNRISVEFDMLYRWHPLVPDTVVLGGRKLEPKDYRFDIGLLRRHNIATIIGDAAAQSAGRIMLGNTPHFLREADRGAIRKMRAWRLRPFNEYCRLFGMAPAATFDDLTGDPETAALLDHIYCGRIDDVELLPGLLGETRKPDAVFGELMGLMVGADAFTHALTNPLLAKAVFGRETFGEAGLASIERTTSFEDIARRNCDLDDRRATFSVAA